MKYAVFTVMMPEYSVEDTIQLLAEMGYDGVEFRVTQKKGDEAKPGYWSGNRCTIAEADFVKEAPRLAALCDKAGLARPSVGTYVGCHEPEKAAMLMEGARKLGAPALRVGVAGYDGSENARKVFEKITAQYRVIEDLAKKHKVKALAEIHMGNMIPGASSAYRFISQFDPAHVGIILDPGNMIYEGFENWQMGLEILGEYLVHVHAKNAAWKPGEVLSDGTQTFACSAAPLEKGQVNWHTLAAGLKKVGYDVWISFEDFSEGRDTRTKLEYNLGYMKGVVGG